MQHFKLFYILLALILITVVFMAIKHSRVVVTGNKGEAADWNDDHVVDDDSKPKNFTTLIVAASNSLDTTRADYVCDGIDDQDTINTAMAALPAGGGRISLQEGTYQITGPIIVDKDNVTIEGLGAATIIQTADNVDMISATNMDNILIADMRLIGAGAGHNTNEVIWLVNCTESVVRGLWIEQAGASGVYMNGCEFVTVSNCFITDNQNYGIAMLQCNYCIIESTSSNANGAGFDGINLWDCAYNKIVSCYFDQNNNGITFTESAPAINNHNLITGCTVINNNNTGIIIAAGVSRSVVTDNMVVGNTVAQITDNGANTALDNNQVL